MALNNRFVLEKIWKVEKEVVKQILNEKDTHYLPAESFMFYAKTFAHHYLLKHAINVNRNDWKYSDIDVHISYEMIAQCGQLHQELIALNKEYSDRLDSIIKNHCAIGKTTILERP